MGEEWIQAANGADQAFAIGGRCIAGKRGVGSGLCDYRFNCARRFRELEAVAKSEWTTVGVGEVGCKLSASAG